MPRLAARLLLLLALVVAAKKKKAAQKKKPPQAEFQGLNSENMPASSFTVEGGGELPKNAPTPKFKQIREEDIPPGTPVKTVHDGDLLDLTGGEYDEEKKRKYSKKVTKMFDAIMTDDADQINQALNYGIDINIPGPQGYTPLFQAVFSHRINAVKLLLARGADAAKRNFKGFNPLDAAAFSGCAECAHMLLKHGVNPHLVHPDGYNALHRAIWGDEPEHTEVVRMLLEAGVSPSKPASVPDKGYLEPLNMVGENEATKSLLENYIDKEEREMKRRLKARAEELKAKKQAKEKEEELAKAFGKKEEL